MPNLVRVIFAAEGGQDRFYAVNDESKFRKMLKKYNKWYYEQPAGCSLDEWLDMVGFKYTVVNIPEVVI